jgi:outer membrane protein OmpA-like peptidoglycan-associated protein/antitoxin component of MazEF toxin-antitoxin module
VLVLAVALTIGLPSSAQAQLFDKIKERATGTAESEVLNRVDLAVRGGMACVFSDLQCIQGGQDDGEDVYLTDENGEYVLDDEGNPVSDPDQAAEILGKAPPGASGAASAPGAAPGVPGVTPGAGADANLDFVPGDRVVLEVDYADDNLGDFPRRFDLVQGSFDVIEWEGTRYVRAIAGGSLAIVLPETLPEKFTLETSVSVQHGNASLRITPGRAYHSNTRDYSGSGISVEYVESGILAVGNGPDAMAPHDPTIVASAVAPLRVMADGEHMKLYLGDRRVANVPNAVFPRTDTLFVAVDYAYEAQPILMGPIRIAASQVDLYDRLAREGRVTTRGILFDVDSDVIREESAPTLDQIGTMLQVHPDLRISIEGHTDADGEEAYNRELSERRAASVRDRLIESYGIDPSRLESRGFGESVPLAPNDTAEGKQQNRRVELVRL